MMIRTPQATHHTYTLLDSGNGQRLEQFGNRRIIRPDSTCLWKPATPAAWNNAQIVCTKAAQGGKFRWVEHQSSPLAWTYTYHHPTLQPLSFALRASESSKNIGIFPEQATHWDWLAEKIPTFSSSPSILNLFAYTGGASLVAAAAGAKVCHVDASKTTVSWARQNAENNGLKEAPIRWIVEDCLVFMEREIKRGKKYEGIIMDPPAFGRDPRGNPFNFDTAIDLLLKAAQQLLTAEGFLLLNVYSVPFYATHISNLVQDYFPSKTIETGELHLVASNKRSLPCNIFVKIF